MSMATADISALGNLEPVQELDLETYADTSGFRLPRAGEYTLRAPETIGAEAFSKSQAGYLTARVDPTIVGPTNEGFEIRFVRISAKPYENKGSMISQAALYLRACGVKRTPGTNQEIADAIASTAGKTYPAYLDWEVRYQGVTLKKGMKNFPSDGKGGYQSWIEHPSETNPETGEPLRLRANLVVSRFLSAA